ncbi:MAG: hypothetical protein JXO72_01025 [Vicinamibacteria bacterium]|nr:hypothetical protein [Vicinamibacteria bacterium]
MAEKERIPMVYCRLDPPSVGDSESVRYVPLSEFGLWKHLMEHRHGRRVRVLSASVWISEDPTEWNSGYLPGDLAPVVRLRFETSDSLGMPTRIERFFPALHYPRVQEALFRHYPDLMVGADIRITPGYFVPRGFHRPV